MKLKKRYDPSRPAETLGSTRGGSPRFMAASKRIPLTQGFFARVSAADYSTLSQHKWHVGRSAGGRLYAKRSVFEEGKNKFIYMHRAIVGLHVRKVDHRDGDGLNNTRRNLRPANDNQNCWNANIRSDNTTGYKGVTFVKERGKFMAQIRFKKRQIFLGHFTNPQDAHAAYAAAAKKYFNTFAKP